MGLFDFFFSDEEESESTSTSAIDSFSTGVKTKELELDPAAIDKVIADVLGGTQGLAEIFSGEQTAGIFDSTVAAQASGDLVANLVGEIAKLTAKEVETAEESVQQTTSSTGTAEGIATEGLVGQATDLIGAFF